MGAGHPAPVGLYLPWRRIGDQIAISGISSAEHGVLITGKVGADLDEATGRKAARRCAINLLSVLEEACEGDLDRLAGILMVRGFVNAADGFDGVHRVIDAASEVLIAALGDARGAHARTAVGCATLPNGNAVTLDAMVVLRG